MEVWIDEEKPKVLGAKSFTLALLLHIVFFAAFSSFWNSDSVCRTWCFSGAWTFALSPALRQRMGPYTPSSFPPYTDTAFPNRPSVLP
jgi:hypothetical protein